MFNYLVNRDEPLKIKIENFLKEDITPTLTEDERVILRNLQPEITLIGRNGANELFIAIDSTNEFVDFFCYDHLFQFIKERRRIRNKGAIKMKCLVCGKEFVPKSKVHKYCSMKCKIKVARAMYKKYSYQNKRKRVLKRVVERRRI